MDKKTLYVLILLLLCSALPIIMYINIFGIHFNTKHSSWGEFGSFLSGVYGSFAFLILAYTTHLTRTQFKIQNEDNVFFKLYESLQKRIENYSIHIEDKEYTGNQALKILTEEYKKELRNWSANLARRLLVDQPEKIPTVSFHKLVVALYGEQEGLNYTQHREQFISEMNSQPDKNQKIELLKDYFGSEGAEGEKVFDALCATGSVQFYNVPFKTRKSYYRTIIAESFNKYGDFLDGYLHNILYIIEFADKAENRSLYLDYIKSQLTKYELLIIFYLMASKEEIGSSKNKFYDLGIMQRLEDIECSSLLLDSPSPEQIATELRYIFKASS